MPLAAELAHAQLAFKDYYSPLRIRKAESWEARVADHEVVAEPAGACAHTSYRDTGEPGA